MKDRIISEEEIAYLKEYFKYDETSPTFLRWNKTLPSNTHKVGEVAGCIGIHGYGQVRLKNKQYKIHRIIMVLHDIDISNYQVDHIDGNRSNNNFQNLRKVDAYANMRNQKKFITNKSGVTGISLSTDWMGYVSWSAYIIDISGKRVTKSFSINKYGEEKSFQLACEWREKMIKELNEKGAGYSERHGT